MKIFKNRLITVFGLIALLVVSADRIIWAMDLPRAQVAAKNIPIFVKTSDGAVIPVERWQITQMKTLLVLLEHQRDTNNYDNPLNASMIHSGELRLLIDAFKASRELVFEEFFMDLAQSDGLLEVIKDKGPRIRYTLGEGKLRMLVNAAEKVEAQGLVALCGTYYLPKDMQKIVAADMVNPVVDFLKEKIIRTADKEEFIIQSSSNVPFDSKNCVFSPDSTRVYVGFDEKIEVWELATRKIITTFSEPGLSSIAMVALSADGQLCAAGGRNQGIDRDEIIIWNISSGQLIRKYTTNAIDKHISALAFNPINNNQIVFGYQYWGDHRSSHFLDIPTGKTTRLGGYNHSMRQVSFSSDGTKVLGQPYIFLDDVAIWDVASGNLIMRIRPHFATYCADAMFCGSNERIMIAGATDQDNGQLVVEIGNIKNNNYVVEEHFGCDQFFSRNKQDFSRNGFPARFSFDKSKVALCSSYFMNAPEYYEFGGGKKLEGSLMFICKNDFRSVLLRTYFFRTGITSIVWAPNDKWIALISNKKFILLPLLPEQKEKILNSLSDLTIAQVRLLYQLYCARLHGLSVGIRDTDKDNAVFMAIPLEIRLFLERYLFNKRPTEKEGQECIGDECIIL